MNDFIKNTSHTIDKKRLEISKLQSEIRELCFECVYKQKDITIGDLIYIPSKNKYGIFSELHNEDVNNLVIKSNLLTKQGMPSKNITTVSINDLEKVTETIENIVTNNFSGEDFEPQKSINVCKEVINNLKNK